MTATYTRNILRIYRATGPDDRAEGLTWYADANAFARSLDDNVERAAAVIAALSPMLPWPRNVRLARAHYDGVYGGCLTTNSDKARRILSGEDYRNVLSGPKVWAFFHNVMCSPDHVTIDRHAVDIAVGKTLTDAERSPYFGVKNRAVLTKAYFNAAKIASKESGENVFPYQVQAITWVHWRKHYAKYYHGNG